MLAPFAALSRFEIIRCLGQGAMGLVYEVYDTQRKEHVALKTMLHADADALVRFKREFRSLQDLHHPNLVSLWELLVENDQAFFTMELVEGVDFLTYVRCPASAENENAQPFGFDERRLRQSLAGLVSGLCALHAAGHVHRDIKPTNVHVTNEGRVVVLDFGLVLDATRRDRSLELGVVGTPAYMAPEQAAGKRLDAAADWYGVGVLLFEALTGRRPFEGTPLQLLMNKQNKEPPRPDALVPDVPADLAALTMELLRFEPSARPTGSDLKRRLNLVERDPSAISRTNMTPFVGRRAEQGLLAQALADARRGATVVLVHGESGVGKSCLVRRFADAALAAAPETVVFSGRCYERESVPYKALDGVIDALASYLSRLSREDAAGLVPQHAAELAQVFPVFMRVRAVAGAVARATRAIDPHEVRRRAFAALRELLSRLVSAPVLIIDDLQWADADSLVLLADLLRPPDAPPLLLIATVRTGTAGASSRETLANQLPCSVRMLEVGRLPADEATALATMLLERATTHSPEQARQIAQEASGHPLFIDELVRHTMRSDESKASLLVRLDDALWTRIEGLEPAPRKVLELSAVAGAPLSVDVLALAAGLDTATCARATAYLRVARFTRSGEQRNSDRVEPYHDRVREAVVARLSEEVRSECHEKLALALEATNANDPELLATHWTSAGQIDRAARYTLQAAEQANTALAFDRAARLYREALGQQTPDADNERKLRARLAEALANAGRGPEASIEFRAASVGARAAEALEFKRRAAEQLIRSGHCEEGIAVLGDVLSSVRLKLPRSRLFAALLTVFWGRVARLRGLWFRERDVTQVSPLDLTRLDVYWSVSAGIAIVDNVLATALSRRSLLLALHVGEPYRIARVLGQEMMANAISGLPNRKRTAAVTKVTEQVAERSGNPHAIGFTTVMRGTSAFLEGRFQDTVELCRRGELQLRDHCTGVAWEIGSARIFALWATYFLGGIAELCRVIPPLRDEALGRGDNYLRTNLSVGNLCSIWLAADDPDRAAHEVSAGMAAWSRTDTHLQHYYERLALGLVAMYRGDVAGELAELEQRWKPFTKAFIFRLQRTVIDARQLRGRLYIARAQELKGSERAHFLQLAERDAKRIEKERAPWGNGLALLLRAGIASVRGDRDRTQSLLASAGPALDASHMRMFAAAARYQHGKLVGGESGEAQRQRAEAYMRSESIREPERFLRILVPGFSEP
jgi:hypothetical protein